MDNKKDRSTKPSSSGKRFGFSWWIFIITDFLLLLLFQKLISQTPEEITWQQLEKNLLNRNAVDKMAVVNGEYVEIYIKESFSKDAFKKVFKPSFGIATKNKAAQLCGGKICPERNNR